MAEIAIEFPDGSQQQFEVGVTPLQIARTISDDLAQATVAAKFNGDLIAKEEELKENGPIELITPQSDDYLKVMRHSASHVLAQAVKRIYPSAKLGIGPATDTGFYYDFDNLDLEEEDLAKIKKIMEDIIESDLEFERKEVDKEEVGNILQEEPYKLELLDELEEGETITVYRDGDFVDLCSGPHLDSTGDIGAIDLLNIAGAYWKGDEANQMLQRIYGTAFKKEKDLEEFLERREKAKERDHRKLGKQLDLFSLHEVTGSGLPLYHPQGALVRRKMMQFIRQVNEKSGYQEVFTPHMFRSELWKKSGHYEAFKDDMFIFEVEGEEYAVKPMNCPGHIQIYKSDTRSYRDLPLRYSEFGTVYRDEQRGELSGLLRVRALTQDDGHAFIRQDQVETEIINMLEMAEEILSGFGIQQLEYKLATKPDKGIGSDAIWEEAIDDLKKALEEKKLDYEVEEGEGAFYGPKIDIHIKDALGRRWQCSTIQLDFFMPKRFELEYVGEDGDKHRPIMLHRALVGTLDRFLAILIEHYGGKFPLWLAPEQVRVLPIADRHNDYARDVQDKLKEAGLEVGVDDRSRTLDYKIREAQEEKTPYMIVVGDNEVDSGKVAVRDRREREKYEVDLEKLKEELKEEEKQKKVTTEVTDNL